MGSKKEAAGEDDDNLSGDSEKDMNSHFLHMQQNSLNAPVVKSDSPQLSPSQADTFLTEKDMSLEGDNISSAEDNISNVGDNLSGIGDSISGLGDNISGMVDRMMEEISPGVIDLSCIAASAAEGGVIDGSDRESEGSEISAVKHQQSPLENKHSVEGESEDQENNMSPRLAHRLPSGPFVVGDQVDISTGVFAERPSGSHPATSTSSILLDPSSFPSPLGLEPSPFFGQSLLEKYKGLSPSPDRRSVKKLLEYQNLTSRPLPRQQKVRTDLSLADKVRLINVAESTGKSQRSLAAEFHISVGSVNNILRRKREYKEAFEDKGISNSNSKLSVYYRRAKVAAYNELQMLIMRWLEVAKVKIKPLTWPVVMEKAREFAAKLEITNFQSSAAWLEKLRQSMDIPLRVMPVFVRSENDATLLGMWHKMLPFLVQGYQAQNIFSVTETTLYYKCLPDFCYIGGPMCQNSHSHMELLEHRLTVLLCCNSLGERLKPLVISRHTCPPSLRGVPVEELPVVWCHQPSAVITADIFAGWLRSLEASMAQQRRHIALFMEMTPSHLSSTVLKHISLKFYLDDSSHLLQPFNQGIVRDFKAYFRRRFLQTALARASSADGVEEDGRQATKSVTELDAMFWIQEAWRSISTDSVRACFNKAGFPEPAQSASAQKAMPGIEPLPSDFLHLVHEAGRVFHFTPMSPDIYAEFDSQLPCHSSDMEDWEKTLLAEVTGGRMKHIKREPGDIAGEDTTACSSTSGREEEGRPEETVGSSEALESLGKLKRFSSSNIGLLTTVYELESLLLDSFGSSLHR